MDRVEEGVSEVQGWGHVIGDAGGGIKLRRTFLGFPGANELDKQIVGEASIEHLADHEDVGRECGLQHDGHIGGVEESDGIRAAHAALARGLDRNFDAEALEIDDGRKYGEGRQQIHDVREMLSVEGFAESAGLVGPGHQEVEKSNNCALEFFTTTGVNGRRGESLPYNGLADVCRDEEGDSRSQSVSLLQQFVKQDDHETSKNKLDNQEKTDASTKIARLAIETSEHENAGLTEGEDDGEEFLGGLIQFAVGLEVEVDVNEMGTGKELRSVRNVPSLLGTDGGTWNTMPDEMIGVVPNSISVPRLLANIIRNQ